MDTKEKASAHTTGDWIINGSRQDYFDIESDGKRICSLLANRLQLPEGMSIEEVKANARLIVQSANLLRLAESAVNAFEERISCLKDELLEEFCDADDINDQIGNYQWLRDQHRKVIAKVRGKAG